MGQLTRDILERYKRQNPVKYLRKFGDRPIDEILGLQPPAQPEPVEAIRVETTTVTVLKPEFSEPEAPKKRRKK